MIRAKVRRDGPGEWSWTLQDDHGDLVTGINGSWSDALGEVTDELRLMAETTQPPGVEIPFADDLAELHAAADANERLLSEIHREAERYLRGPITPGDAKVPAVDFRCDGRPAWKRWLGL